MGAQGWETGRSDCRGSGRHPRSELPACARPAKAEPGRRRTRHLRCCPGLLAPCVSWAGRSVGAVGRPSPGRCRKHGLSSSRRLCRLPFLLVGWAPFSLEWRTPAKFAVLSLSACRPRSQIVLAEPGTCKNPSAAGVQGPVSHAPRRTCSGSRLCSPFSAAPRVSSMFREGTVAVPWTLQGSTRECGLGLALSTQAWWSGLWGRVRC